MKSFHSIRHLPILILFSISVIYYFNFTAEDAYITYRYAENWVNTGALVYNEGEPINAMTSPLHAVLSAALFFLTGHTVLSNKILALGLVLTSAILVWNRFRAQPHWQPLVLILVLLPPSVLLWTFGGLETPILLFLATTSVLLALRTQPFELGRLCMIFVLGGLAFLTRYDSSLFFLPVTLYAASRAQSMKHVVIALAGAAILPLVWLFISSSYYGDLLPTSFYVKTPKGGWGDLIRNGEYIGLQFLYIGIIPVLVIGVVLAWQKRGAIDVLFQHIKRFWWLYAGLALEILYGLTIATHHMMFSFRFFVPYIPAVALLVVDLVRHVATTSEVDLTTGRPAFLFTGFLLCLTVFQIYQNLYTYRHSLNGISPIGEYQALGVRDYVKFLQLLRQEALDIEDHWEKKNEGRGRPPRIITYAAGMLPYTYRESYIYEKLVSYRHCHERYQQGLHADYLHILAPRQGTVDEQLPKAENTYELVSSYQMFFDGSMQEFLVYYNPRPEEHNLSVRIDEHCNSDISARIK